VAHEYSLLISSPSSRDVPPSFLPTRYQATDFCIGVKTFFANPVTFEKDSLSNPGMCNTSSINDVVFASSPANNIVARFQKLKRLSSRDDIFAENPAYAHLFSGRNALCEYVDIIKGRNERLLLVSEHYKLNLRSLLKEKTRLGESEVRRISGDILLALAFLHVHGIVHRNLSPDNILFNSNMEAKLADYGLYYISDCGSYVPFLIGKPEYWPPEILLNNQRSAFEADIWMLGVLIVEMLTGDLLLEQQTSNKNGSCVASEITAASRRRKQKKMGKQLPYLLSTSLYLCGGERAIAEHSQNEEALAMFDTFGMGHGGTVSSSARHVLRVKQHERIEKLLSLPHVCDVSEEMKQIIRWCLTPLPSERPHCDQLLQLCYFADVLAGRGINVKWVPRPFMSSFLLQSPKDTYNYYMKECADHTGQESNNSVQEDDSFDSVQDAFHFWKLAGGQLEDLPGIELSPPIQRLPFVVRAVHSLHEYRNYEDESYLYDDTFIILTVDEIKSKLSEKGMTPKSALMQVSEVIEDADYDGLPPLQVTNPACHQGIFFSHHLRFERQTLITNANELVSSENS